jgi:para-nitrobenzyl esterase
MPDRLMLAIIAIAATVAAPTGLAARNMASDMRIAQGNLRGVEDGGVRVFKGIPYAAPPTGPLRWRPPAPAPRWQGVRPAEAFRASCPQVPYKQDSAPLETATSEDCLTLNIWTPLAGKALHPVMVWIHGGGFMNGGAAAAVHDGRALARQGVVVVTFNYRLGRLGFFAHPALTAESPDGPLGNYGLLDQIAALRWVQDNIRSFGGDPANVTMFGESAGGGSVAGLLNAPLARGLFAKAIIESGGGRQTPIPIRGPGLDGGPSMEEVGMTVARDLGIAGDDATALAKLRALPADKVVGGINMLNNNDRARTVNWMVDGRIVVEDPLSAFIRGHQARVPLIVGANSDELGAVPMIDSWAQATLARFGDQAAALKAAYRAIDGSDQLHYLPSDAFFVEPARFTAQAATAVGQPAFHYRFDYLAGPVRGTLKGARHASEIPYVFDNPDLIPGATEADRAMAAKVSAAWVRFAKAGNPSGEGWSWPAYGKNRATLTIGNGGPSVIHDLDRARLDLIERAYQEKIWSKLVR